MKPTCLILMLVSYLSATLIFAQENPQAEAELRKKMEPFTNWVGEWKGEGSMQRGPQNSTKSNVVEKIETRLNGSIIVVEGLGTITDPERKSDKVVHHAFGILSYDPLSNQYRMRSYLADGKSTDAWFNILAENKYQWGFDTPQGKVRYTITIDPVAQTWQEIGEFSRDEKTWYKNFEMMLKKTGKVKEQ